MSDCCIDFPISCAPKAPGGCNPCGPCKPPRPCPPPAVKPGTSMYIGARYVPIFADPVYWSNDRAFEPLTIVVKDGDCYTSKCYVPEGAPLPVRPENQNTYWVRTSDYNYQFEELRQAVVDLSKQVEKFAQDNKDFTAQMQAWNTTMQEWSGKIEDWGQTMDQFNTRVEAVENGLAEEIARAKAAEAANAAAITAEADRAKGEETKIANRVTVTETDITAIKAEQTIQNNNISANAKNIQDNAAEIAKHAKRLTDLESNASDWDSVFPDTTIAQEMKKEQTARANGDTALNGRCDAITADVEEVRDIANHKVDATTYTAGQAAQDAKITANTAALAGKADKSEIPDVSGFVTTETYTQGQAAQDTKIAANAAALAGKADKSEIPDLSGFVTTETYTQGQAAQDTKIAANAAALAGKADKSEIPDLSGFVTTETYTQGQAAQDAKITAAQTAADKANTSIGDWKTEHPGKTIAQAVTDVSGSIPDVSEFVTNAKRGEVFPIFLNMHTASDYYLPIGTFNGSSIAFLIPTSKFLQDRTLLNLCDRYGTKQEGRPYTYIINKADGVTYTDTTIDPGYYLRPNGPTALLEIFPSLSTVQKLKPGEPIILRELKMVDTQLFISVENITEPES